MWKLGTRRPFKGAFWLACWALAMFATAAVAQEKAKGTAKPKEVPLTGFIGDTNCGVTHHLGGGAKKCTMRCVKTLASKYALVIGQKIYTLEGKEAELEKLAGERATVKGSLQGATMKVSSVVSAKFEEAPDMD